MRIVRPYAHITSDSVAHAPLAEMRHIEQSARISHRSEDKQTDDSWRRFIQSVVLDHGDWSVVEHVSVSVDALVDRGVTHEWVRHRLFSFTQESTRFVNYDKKMPPSFVYPKPEVECALCLFGNEVKMGNWRGVHDQEGGVAEDDCPYSAHWLVAIQRAENGYKELIANGWRPQEARSVLPNALASLIRVTGNLRSWRHLFIMRTTSETHPQFRQVTIPLLAEFQACFPLLFDDIIPLARQGLNMRLPR